MTKDFLESPVSAKTERNYKHGLKVFYEFYPKPLQMPFKERAGRKDYMEILRLDGADTLQAILIRGSLPGRTRLIEGI